MKAQFDWLGVNEVMEEEELDSGRKIYGVVTGTVINVADPQALGRVQVQLPFIDSIDLSPWARIAVPMAGMFYGTYFAPTIGEEVLVAFEHGDVRVPYIIGFLWHHQNRPPVPSPLLQKRAIRTPTGNQIIFEEVPPTVTIQNSPTTPEPMPAPPLPTVPYQTVKLSPEGVNVTATAITMQCGTETSVRITPVGIILQTGSSVITMTKDSLTIAGKNVSVVGTKVQVVGTDVRINS